ncbi:hypothetical protein AAFF_G00163590 [Aldrovandia affinis]|uniref:Uncharacterized protein n=1 Tax=Aldrovandia affinis TaxID=143900 RepID=A0AAD7WVX1_9TELE|nr:hypothetical protein AAFF_G00163590 [Aldrovandia affinis]
MVQQDVTWRSRQSVGPHTWPASAARLDPLPALLSPYRHGERRFGPRPGHPAAPLPDPPLWPNMARPPRSGVGQQGVLGNSWEPSACQLPTPPAPGTGRLLVQHSHTCASLAPPTKRSHIPQRKSLPRPGFKPAQLSITGPGPVTAGRAQRRPRFP